MSKDMMILDRKAGRETWNIKRWKGRTQSQVEEVNEETSGLGSEAVVSLILSLKVACQSILVMESSEG